MFIRDAVQLSKRNGQPVQLFVFFLAKRASFGLQRAGDIFIFILFFVFGWYGCTAKFQLHTPQRLRKRGLLKSP